MCAEKEGDVEGEEEAVSVQVQPAGGSCAGFLADSKWPVEMFRTGCQDARDTKRRRAWLVKGEAQV